MQLIVGLGNPDSKYNFTRHNFGFLALDFYAKLKNLTWQKPKFGALWCKDGDRLLIKPQEYYNNSGQAVRGFVDFYKLSPSDLLVICDDFNLPFGTLRYRANGSDGGNNGLKSITAHLGTQNFPRLRLGTGDDAARRQLGDTDFVLSKFSPAEKAQLSDLLPEILRKIDEFC